MTNRNHILISIIGFIITYIYQILEDKRLNIKRKQNWNKIKFPILITLIIYLTLSFFCFNKPKEINNYEIFTELASF